MAKLFPDQRMRASNEVQVKCAPAKAGAISWSNKSPRIGGFAENSAYAFHVPTTSESQRSCRCHRKIMYTPKVCTLESGVQYPFFDVTCDARSTLESRSHPP